MYLTHGHTTKGRPSPTWYSWKGLRERCNNPNVSNYEDYGARGITYDPRWESFENFLEDMGERPEGHTLDRIDCNGNYEPSNCRWATLEQQQNNRNNTAWIEFQGECLSISQWARKLNIKRATLESRIRQNKWSVERALTTPSRRKAA